MQDKALDAMAKKYKEEMMRLYAGGSRPSASGKPSAAAENTANPRNETVNGISHQPQEHRSKNDTDRLMHPPMPKIPNVSQKCEEKAAENTQGGKFPSPEELMAGHMTQETVRHDVQQNTTQTESMPRFDNAHNLTHEQANEKALEQSQKHDHEQGNYDFTEAEQDRMFTDGEGYLKLEVNSGGQPVDCALAAVFRVNDSGDVLTATFFTDTKGETEVITLPVLGLDEKYTVTVAKEGFFTVHDLEIPIFDSIKSIQPVELKKEQK